MPQPIHSLYINVMTYKLNLNDHQMQTVDQTVISGPLVSLWPVRAAK